MSDKKQLFGTDPNQVPRNRDLGTMAYVDSDMLGMVLYASYETSNWNERRPSTVDLFQGGYLSTNSTGDNFHIPIDSSYKTSVVYVTRSITGTGTNHEYLALHYESGTQVTSQIETVVGYLRNDGTSGVLFSGATSWPRITDTSDCTFLLHTVATVYNSDANQVGYNNRPGVKFENTYTWSGIGVCHTHGSLSVNNAGGTIGALQFNTDVVGGGNNTYGVVDWKVFGIR